jgi:hypothetical protein
MNIAPIAPSASATTISIVKPILKSLRFEAKMMKKASDKKTFVRVTSQEGKSITDRRITGVKNVWTKFPRDVFSTAFRISGTPEDITLALRNANVSEIDIQNALANAITSTNWNNTAKAIYDLELKEYKDVKDTEVKTKPTSNFNLKGGNGAWLRKAKISSGVVKVEKKTVGKGGGRGKSLGERIKSLEPGRVLDVSKMLANLTGAKRAAAPGLNSQKRGVPGLALVSSDPTNYYNALVNIFGNDKDTINRFWAAYQTPAKALTTVNLAPVVATSAMSPRMTAQFVPSFAVPNIN